MPNAKALSSTSETDAELASNSIIREPNQDFNPSEEENSGKVEKFGKREPYSWRM